VGEYRGPAMLTADGQTPVEVLAALVAQRDLLSRRWTWRGRVTPVHGTSLLDFLRAENVQIHVDGRPNLCRITSLGTANSEVEGLGPPTF
jgi:Domain of unknown function (DUF4873)